jgi:hypothetical protein
MANLGRMPPRGREIVFVVLEYLLPPPNGDPSGEGLRSRLVAGAAVCSFKPLLMIATSLSFTKRIVSPGVIPIIKSLLDVNQSAGRKAKAAQAIKPTKTR